MLLRNRHVLSIGGLILASILFIVASMTTTYWPSWTNGPPSVTPTLHGHVAGSQTINVTDCGCLNQSNTDYILQNDVSSNGSCFTLGGNNSSLDLNGHTVTFDNAAPTTVSNGGFELGSGGAATDWDFSSAANITRFAGSYISPVEVYEGSYGLKFTLPAANQYIRSTQTVTLAANTTYSIGASMYNYASDNASLYVKFVGTSTQATRTGKTWRGFSWTAAQITTGASPETYTIEVGITGAGSEPAGTIYLDDVQVLRYRTTGVAQGAASWMSTKPLDLPCYGSATGSVVKNGSIIQGNAGSDRGYAVYVGANSIETKNLTINVHSTNARAISSDQEAKTLNIHDNTITNNVVTIGRREGFDGVSIISNRPNATKVYNNTITGGAQNGIVLEDFRGMTVPNEVYGNTISLTASRTNDFAINLWSDNSTSVYNNTIDCTQGTDGCRGIFTGGGATGTKIYNNTVSVREKNRNQEYNGCEINGAYGIQIEYASNIEIYGNTVMAVADVCPAYAFRTNPVDGGGAGTGQNINVHDNTFIANHEVGYSNQASSTLITEVQDPAVLLFNNNTVVSNDRWFALTGDTSFIPFTSTTFSIGSNPVSPFWPLYSDNPAPPGPSSVDIHFVDNHYANSSAQTIFENTNFACQGSAYACAAGGGNPTDKYASFYYDWYLTVAVQNNSQIPISNAQVTITNKNGTQVFSGLTDSNGHVQVQLAQYRNAAGVKTQYNPYSISVVYNAAADTQTTTLDGSKTVTVTLNINAGGDSTSPAKVNDLIAE